MIRTSNPRSHLSSCVDVIAADITYILAHNPPLDFPSLSEEFLGCPKVEMCDLDPTPRDEQGRMGSLHGVFLGELVEPLDSQHPIARTLLNGHQLVISTRVANP